MLLFFSVWYTRACTNTEKTSASAHTNEHNTHAYARRHQACINTHELLRPSTQSFCVSFPHARTRTNRSMSIGTPIKHTLKNTRIRTSMCTCTHTHTHGTHVDYLVHTSLNGVAEKQNKHFSAEMQFLRVLNDNLKSTARCTLHFSVWDHLTFDRNSTKIVLIYCDKIKKGSEHQP